MNLIDKYLGEEKLDEGRATSNYVQRKGSDTTQMQCNECGKRFKKKIGPRTYEIKCPKCGSYDTEPA